MRTLTVIFATGALLVAVAPTAGARSVHCSAATKHTASVHVRTVDPDLPAGYRIERRLVGAGTCKAIKAVAWTPGLTPAVKYQIQQELQRDSR